MTRTEYYKKAYEEMGITPSKNTETVNFQKFSLLKKVEYTTMPESSLLLERRL